MTTKRSFLVRSQGRGAFSLTHDDRSLFDYVWLPNTPPIDSPHPYFHPLRTIQGEVTTDSSPEDHPWHQGLSMTCANLSGVNFWGGPTYVRGRGYVQLTNNGRIEHRDWAFFDCSRDQFSALEHLEWVDPDGASLLEERRTITVRSELINSKSWALELDIELTNSTNRTLEFGSPTTAGRPAAGYGGLFWRGAPAFNDATVLVPGDVDDAMGHPAPWLALRTKHGQSNSATLLFVDHPDNPRYPNSWFVRTEEYPGVSFSFAFDKSYPIPVGGGVHLRYLLSTSDGMWTRSEIDERVEALKSSAFATN